jgi:phenylacetate-CoA ligase
MRVAQNVVPVELVGLDRGALLDMTNSLRRGLIDAILGYSSALHRLARYVVDTGEAGDFGLRVIISGAEVLAPPARQQIQAAFGCPVADRYANEENGVLACKMPGEDHFRVNRASFHIELLQPERDVPALPGRPGRVVVTDLYNRAMPLIRYETGDLAIVGEVVDGTVVTLLGVEGRSADVIHSVTGVPISEAMADMILVEFDDLVRYQLVQEDASTYVLRVVLGATPYGPDRLSAWLRRMLGASASIRVDTVDDIPLRSNAKFRPLLNLYHPAGEGSEAGHRGR